MLITSQCEPRELCACQHASSSTSTHASSPKSTSQLEHGCINTDTHAHMHRRYAYIVQQTTCRLAPRAETHSSIYARSRRRPAA